jgi:cysteine desulfurase
MAAALVATDAERKVERARIGALRDRLVGALVERVEGLRETVPAAFKVAGSAHVCVDGIESEALLYLLDEAGLCASAASACASGAMEPSHVLAAMGVDPRWSGGALRMTLGRTTTDADVEGAVDILTEAIATLRARAVASQRTG